MKPETETDNMARIPLSVCSEYLPNWGVHEGLRELVQNYIDAADDSGVKGEIRYEGGTARGRVFLRNPSARPLTREALLFGATSKADRADQRGQFGEGMKVGTLALVRAGRSVTIRTQAETWVASLSPAPDFGGRKVLTFDTRKRSTEVDAVEVEIGPVEMEEWNAIRNAFMFMQEEEEPVNSEKGYTGALLLDARHRDAVFAKGILVTRMEGCRYGYDLANLDLNRDRSMVNEWDVRYQVVSLISEQYRKGTVTLSDISSMFLDNTWEMRDGNVWMYSSVGRDLLVDMVERKKKSSPFARGIIVTSSEDEAVKAESYGYAPVRIPKNLQDAVRHFLVSDKDEYLNFRKKVSIVTYAEMIAEMQDAIEVTHTLSDLTVEERGNLDWSIALLSRVDVSVNPEIVTFIRNDLLGLYKGGKISLSRSILTDKQETLGTLIHEYSHGWGGDGSIEHTRKIEETWVKVARHLCG
jgi:hypothetical protein